MTFSRLTESVGPTEALEVPAGDQDHSNLAVMPFLWFERESERKAPPLLRVPNLETHIVQPLLFKRPFVFCWWPGFGGFNRADEDLPKDEPLLLPIAKKGASRQPGGPAGDSQALGEDGWKAISGWVRGGGREQQREIRNNDCLSMA